MTTNPAQQQLGTLLRHAAADLDIPESVRTEAREKYEDLGHWLKRDHEQKYNSDACIYVQGSTRLGTDINPVKTGDEYDVDLVYRRDIQKQIITQEQLKHQLGEQLKRYIQYLKLTDQPVPKLVEGSRCWTLDYPGKFHMDILPALPDDDASSYNIRDIQEGIIIPDKDLYEWHHSNPKGYANWFHDQMREAFLQERFNMSKAASVEVEEILDFRVKTTLQRAVQLLKRHRDLRYAGHPKDKPISIIISTLAAKAYGNEMDFYEAFIGIVQRMQSHIEIRDGVYWVANPVNPDGENFADKWEKEPQRKVRFFEWLDQVERDVEYALQQQGLGLDKVGEALSPVFGESLINAAAAKYGEALLEQRKGGGLRIEAGLGMLGSTGVRAVAQHTNYGD